MAVSNRAPSRGTVIHSDHGSQFTSWAFSERVRQAGLVPSMGTVGDAFDNAVIESFWARLQTELLNRKKWKTRIERRKNAAAACVLNRLADYFDSPLHHDEPLTDHPGG